MDDKIIDNLKSESRWFRLLFMLLFIFAGYIAAMIALLAGVIQTVHGFISSDPNSRLLTFTGGLNRFVLQVLQYITYNSESKPYPFSDWPDDDQSSN